MIDHPAGSYDDLSRRLKELARGDAENSIAMRAVLDALGTEPRTRILKRTPRSDKNRPDYKFYEQAGMGNLINDFDIIKNGKEVHIGFDTVDYAMYVHEMEDPTPSGKPVHWSKPGSGNYFLDGPMEELSEWILNKTDDNMAKILGRYL
jgi:hypothetical protein